MKRQTPEVDVARSAAVSRWRTPLLAAALVLLVVIVYWPTLSNGFVSDDGDYLTSNRTLQSESGLADIWFRFGSTWQYYPLVFSSFWAEYRVWGFDPRGYHLVNMVLHAAAVLLMWRLLLRLSIPGAWLAAAVWAVHPVGVESVAWISERKNVMSCAFALASMLAYFRFCPPEATSPPPRTKARVSGTDWRPYGWYALALALYVAALWSKTVTATMPAVVLVIYWWKRGRLTWQDFARLAPFLAVGLPLSYVTVWMERTVVGASGQEWDFSLVDRVLIAGRALWFYASELVWPHPLIFFYPRWVIDAGAWWQYLFPAAALVVIVALWHWRERIGRGPLAAVLIFAGVLTPALGFFNVYPFRLSYVADHYQYHASIALIALAVAGAALLVARLGERAKWIAPVGAAALLVPLVAIARHRTYDYKDDVTLSYSMLADYPDSWPAHANLGFSYGKLGKFDDAIVHWARTVEIRDALARQYPAINVYREELAQCHVELGIVQQKAERAADAAASHEKAAQVRAQLAQDNPKVGRYQDLCAASCRDVGVLKEQMGRLGEAERFLTAACEIREKLIAQEPEPKEYRDGLAWCYVHLASVLKKQGRPANAAAAHRRGADLRERLVHDDPDNSTYRQNLAASLVDLALVQRDSGQADYAENSLHKAIELRDKLVKQNPGVAEYRDGLGWCYAYLASLQQRDRPLAGARESFGKAIEIREGLVREVPKSTEFASNLAASYTELGILERDAGNVAKAEDLLHKAVDIRQKLSQDDARSPELAAGLAWSLANLGVLQLVDHRPAEAVALCQKATEIRERLVRDYPNAPDYQTALGWSYANLGAALTEAGRPAEAEDVHRNAVRIRVKALQEKPTSDDCKHEIALSCRDLGNALRAEDRAADAAILYRAAVEIRDRLASDHPKVASLRSNLATDLTLLGDALAMSQDWDQAAQVYAKALAASDTLPITWACAMAQLAAGNEAAYRATCAKLASRAKTAPAKALVPIALSMVLGEKSVDNPNELVAIAKRALDADPANASGSVLLGAAQYRAGRHKDALATLAKGLAQPATSGGDAGHDDDQALACRLLGEALLAVGYYEQTGKQVPESRIKTLREWTSSNGAARQAPNATPPWLVSLAVKIAKREIARLEKPPGENASTSDLEAGRAVSSPSDSKREPK